MTEESESVAAKMNVRFTDIEREKQELGQHLAAAFEELEQARAAYLEGILDVIVGRYRTSTAVSCRARCIVIHIYI
jgi:hypothetical protein